MEVERKTCVQGVVRLLVLGVAMQNKTTPLSQDVSNAFDILRPTYGPNLRNHWCQVDVVFVRLASMGTASSLEAPIHSTPPRTCRRRGFHDVVQCFLSRLFSHFRHRLEILTRPPAAIKAKPDGHFHQHVQIPTERGVVGIQSMREELGHGLHRKEVRGHQL